MQLNVESPEVHSNIKTMGIFKSFYNFTNGFVADIRFDSILR